VRQAVRFRDPSAWCLVAIVVITVLGAVLVAALGFLVSVLP
jgi:preprotein translocase subunit Sss1